MGFNPFMFGNPSGVGQQTAVGQHIVMRGATAAARPRRKASRGKKKAVARARRSSGLRTAAKRSRRPARLVKGSAAARRYMASIRRKRR